MLKKQQLFCMTQYILKLIQIGVMSISKQTYLTILTVTLALLSLAWAETIPARDLSYVKLPQGFKIDIFAEVPNARSLVRSDKGTIFVSTRNGGKVYALKDTNGDHKADVIKVLAEKLNMPNGIALKDGNLYVAEVSRILRFDNIEENLDNPKYVVVKDDLPKDTSHGWKFIAFGPDGKLYVPIGAPCNICDKGDPYASITRMNPDGTEFEIFARGIRNSVGFDWDPKTGYIWFTDNGRDNLGQDVPPDELNHAKSSGLHFGYPYCHAGDIKDPQFGTKECSQFEAPSLKFEAHVAPLGVNFYSGKSFPEKYQGGMFIAQHGSWNRKIPIGYRLKFVKVDGEKVVSEETFVDGWLQGDAKKGRPVDTEELEDGSLLVSDDQEGLIYRISYTTPVPASVVEAHKAEAPAVVEAHKAETVLVKTHEAQASHDPKAQTIAAAAQNLGWYPKVTYKIPNRSNH